MANEKRPQEDPIAKLNAHFGIALPSGYHAWTRNGYTDYRADRAKYLWVCEAEWIPPADIPKRDLRRSNIIPGLIPFAFSGAGDNWCWNTQAKNGDAEYDILFCWHDEELADLYAPTFPAWFYRNCLTYASDSIDPDEGSIDEGRDYLRLWSSKLAEIHPGRWADHLATLAEATPLEYNSPKLLPTITSFGFIADTDIDKIVAEEFGAKYVEQKVAWGTWPE